MDRDHSFVFSRHRYGRDRRTEKQREPKEGWIQSVRSCDVSDDVTEGASERRRGCSMRQEVKGSVSSEGVSITLLQMNMDCLQQVAVEYYTLCFVCRFDICRREADMFL